MNENKAIFETMPVPKALATLAVPTILSMLITMVYNMADTYFIGTTNDPYKIAAASLTYVLFFVSNGLANLFGIGGGSLISRLLGIQQNDEARRVCAVSENGTILLSVLYSACCFVFQEPLLRLLGASDNTIGYAASYLFWVVVIGGLPATLSQTMGHMLRSEGYSRQASFGLGMGGVMNILLDPLFMFVILPPGREVTGAAVATCLSNTAALIYFCVTFARLRGRTVLSASPRLVPEGLKYTGQIFAVGFPSTLATFFSCASDIVLNKLMSGHGDIALAAIGIARKLDMIAPNVGMGLCQGMMPLVAYNFSAKNYKRMSEVIRFTRLLGMGFAVVCIILFQIFANQLVGLFIDEPETRGYAAAFLRLVCLYTPMMICNFQMSYTFQAMGKGRQSLLLAACRQGLINIPLMILMNHFIGVYGLVGTQILSETITLVISFILYRSISKKLKEPEHNLV